MSSSIPETVERIIELLDQNDACDWADAFRRIISQFESDPKGVKWMIRGQYDGMGSFSDLVLHRDYKPLIAENNELDRLRQELYQLCQPTL